jgi:primosomal protein N' (replication factor Y)
MPLFADIIIPLALPRVLTYRVAEHHAEHIFLGQRVVIQLGKSNLYTGVVRKLHHHAPTLYEPKTIEDLLDDYALVHETQLKLWEWMADYYKSTLGEVMNAALPSGLKLSSESVFILVNENMGPDEANTNEEATLIAALLNRGSLTMHEIGELLSIKRPQSFVKKMIQQGLIGSLEELKEKFKPKTADFIKLSATYANDKALSNLFEELEQRRAVKQSNTLMVFLQLANWDSVKLGEVAKLKLQEAANVNSSVVSAMVEKGIFEIEVREIGRLNQSLLSTQPAPTLTAIQQKALLEIEHSFGTNDVTLLHGVTSSGKTEIYVHLIEQQLKAEKQVLFLLPEIALTTQIINRLRKYFGKRVGVYHSGYNEHERTEVWNKVLSNTPGEYDIILGARSSLFLPFSRLGLVIVDEEHEQSFKQQDPAPRYHARDTAIMLAHLSGAKVLLGSATPAIETYYNAKHNRYGLVEITERFGGIALPEIVVSDLRAETKSKKLQGNFSSMLIQGIQEAVAAGEQVILFQNRRGYSPLWQCGVCAWIPMCTRCDVSLTYHKGNHTLNCHYCGYYTSPPTTCMACGSADLRMLGFGTEKIEEEIGTFLPDARVQRMDLDTTRNKNSYQNIISDFESGKIQILVGTQMVTKGLDFDNVSLVGIMNADKMMHYPDFRSMERSFQLMMQVAGRAGRKNKVGKVIVQTFSPDHWLLEMVKKADYKSLYEKEWRERQHFGYPPMIRLMKLSVKHKDTHVAQEAAHTLATWLKEALGNAVLGPEPPMVPRINNYYIWQLMIKLERNAQLNQNKALVSEMVYKMQTAQAFKSVRVTIDVDPVN